jgi:putative membrane protein
LDKAYIHAMVEDHQKDAKEYQMESGKAKDAKLKAYVSQTLPIVQQHLSHAQQIQHSGKPAAAKSS